MSESHEDSRADEREDSLCVVVPCFNEAEGVRRFHQELEAALVAVPALDHRILFVDDGSTDATLTVLNELAGEDPKVLVASLARNFGHQIALTAGLSLAEGDAVAVMDSDLQHPPEVLVEMVARWRAGADVVSAVRGKTDAAWHKTLSSRGFYWLLNRLTDTPIVAGAADFCLLSRRAHAALVSMPEHHRFLRGMVAWLGFPREFVQYDAPARFAGETKYSLTRMVGLAVDAIFSFSTTPIRAMTRVGFAITALGCLYLVYIVWRWLSVGDAVAGWPSTLSTILIIGGLQLTFLGVIGEYLARVFEEVKGRPLFVFKQVPGERRTPPVRPRSLEGNPSSGEA